MASATQRCYDFPEIVLHAGDGSCPRYHGGVCRPLPTPTAPLTQDGVRAIRAYQEFLSGHALPVAFKIATGSTVNPKDDA